MSGLRTSDIAKAAGIHTNTVRLYEVIGFLPPVPRQPNGYRCFTDFHLEQVLAARSALRSTWLGGAIREQALAGIYHSAAGDGGSALRCAQAHLDLVRQERARAEAVTEHLRRWAGGEVTSLKSSERWSITATARLIDVTPDELRNWERNGLINVPRDPRNRYRVYGPSELARLQVIRALRRARFSIMSIFRMFRAFEAGQRAKLVEVLDNLPPEEEDIFYSTDRWLSKLREIEGHAEAFLARLDGMYSADNTPRSSSTPV